MLKAHILDLCDGEAYIFVGETVDNNGQIYPRYHPCSYCQGSGERKKWVSVREFANLLERAIAMEPDYQELAQQKPISQYQDSREATGI